MNKLQNQEGLQNKGRNPLIASTIVMGILALGLLIYGYKTGTHVQGMKCALTMTRNALPLLVFAFVAIGMIQVVMPKEGFSHWLGPESGYKGIFLGTVVGALTPGGSLVGLAIMGGILRAGAGIGTLVAFMTSWSIWAMTRLPLEIGLLGWRFTAVRLISTTIFPIVGGIVAKVFFS